MPDSEPPVTQPPCQHRGLPSSAVYDLHGDPTHDHESISTLFELEPNAYGDPHLLAWTDRQWRHWKFQHYRQYHQQKFHDLLSPILPVGPIGRNQCPIWKAGPQHDKFIRDMFRLVDICFFFGTLSIPYGGRKSPLVELVIDGTRGGEKEGRFGVARDITHLHGVAQQRIHIYPYPWVQISNARYLHLMIEILVHEMIHAYARIFLCRRGGCHPEAESACGLTGHGVFFTLLQARITITIRSWGPSLQSYMHDTEFDGSFDSCVSTYSLKEEMDAWMNKSGSSMVPAVPYTLPQWATEVVGFRDEFAYLKDLIRRMIEHFEAKNEQTGANKKRKMEHVEEDSTQPAKDNKAAYSKPLLRSQRKTKSRGSRGT